jgi:hypothetical protein
LSRSYSATGAAPAGGGYSFWEDKQPPQRPPASGSGYEFNFNDKPTSFWGQLPPKAPTYAPNPQTFFAATNPFLNNQRSDLQGDYGLGMSYLGLQQAGTASDLAQLEPMRQNAIALLGLDREQIGLGREGLGIDTGEAHRQAGTQIRGINQDFTSRGAWFAPEKGAQVGDTYASLNDQLARIDLKKRGLDIDEKGVGLREQGTNLDFDSQRSALERQAQKYGLDARELQMRLERGIRDLNLQDVMSVLDLFGQSEAQGQALADKIVEWAVGGK